MTTRPTSNPSYAEALEREVVLVRVLDASPERVFAAWTDPAAVGQWFGPDGFTCEVHEMEVRVGGRWRFTFHGPDGVDYENRVEYLEVDPPHRLVFDHGTDVDDDPDRFRVTVTFDAQDDGCTVLTLRQLHPSTGHRQAVIGFGAVEKGLETMAKLADYLARGGTNVAH